MNGYIWKRYHCQLDGVTPELKQFDAIMDAYEESVGPVDRTEGDMVGKSAKLFVDGFPPPWIRYEAKQHRGTPATDLLSGPVHGGLLPRALIGTQKVVDVLSRFQIGRYDVRPLSIRSSHAQGMPYFLICWQNSGLPYVDWNRSSFLRSDIMGCEQQEVSIDSEDEFNAAMEEQLDASMDDDLNYQGKEVVLSAEAPQLDLVEFGLLLPGVFISTELISAMRELSITGALARETRRLKGGSEV
ncbi:MAG: hypothetical protein JRH20_08260 [Deltaproteobacteria bacterium]|nr:hypothetical protein [Deltaproteobacteria bacterium]